MFGPNSLALMSGRNFHHREYEFHMLMKNLQSVFEEKVSSEYNYYFVTGSGTLANQIVIYSFQNAFEYLFTDAEFGIRLKTLGHHADVYSPSKSIAFPLYETSISRYNVVGCGKIEDVVFVDMISSFPYYSVPKYADIWTTVSSKQIGAYPVVGIIALRKGMEFNWTDERGSYLNMRDYIRYKERKETPFTPCIPLYDNLYSTMKNRFDKNDLIKTIQRRREQVVNTILSVHSETVILGEGPVLTIEFMSLADDWFLKISELFGLYKSDRGYQIFLWSGKDSEYDHLCKSIEETV